jgi:benzoate-CoA ligase
VAITTSVQIPERYNASLLLDGNVLAGRAAKPALTCGDVTLTYADVYGRACAYAGALRELGVGSGDRVLLVLDDRPDLPPVFLGAIRVGAVPVPVNPLYDPSEYPYFVDDSGARLVVVDPASAEKVTGALAGRFDRARILVVGGEAEGLTRLEEAASGQPHDVAPADTRSDDMAFWLYSSGSTGHPKGVVHLQRNVLCTCETYARQVLGIDERDITFSTTKLFHAYGLGNNLSFPYWAGASTVLLTGRPTPDAIFAAARSQRPTLFFSVPTLYNAMLSAGAPGDRPFASVRACVSAAEPLPAEIWHRWHERHGLVILDGIGSTEMLHIYCSNTFEDVVPGSSGRPVPGYELKLVADDAATVVEGEGSGELWVRGDSALARYWNQPERTAESLRDGWFYSRDRYRRDADGHYWYEGRGDDMFKVSGLWVSPAEVEAALMEHPGVHECAVVGASVDGFTKAKAFVVARDAAAAGRSLEEDLRAHCGARLHRYQQPQLFSFVDELPKTLTGKIQRFKLRT